MVFGIKESKRTALEQRALKDMMMSMVSGGGGGADLQGIPRFCTVLECC